MKDLVSENALSFYWRMGPGEKLVGDVTQIFLRCHASLGSINEICSDVAKLKVTKELGELLHLSPVHKRPSAELSPDFRTIGTVIQTSHFGFLHWQDLCSI